MNIGGIGPELNPLSAKTLSAAEKTVAQQMGGLRSQKDLEQKGAQKHAGEATAEAKAEETEHTEKQHEDNVQLSSHAAQLEDQHEADAFGEPQEQIFGGQGHHHGTHSTKSQSRLLFRAPKPTPAQLEADHLRQLEESGEEMHLAEEAGIEPQGEHEQISGEKEKRAAERFHEDEMEKAAGAASARAVQGSSEDLLRVPRTDEDRILEIKGSMPHEVYASAHTMVSNQIDKTRPNESLRELKSPPDVGRIEAEAEGFHGVVDIHDKHCGPLHPDFEEMAAGAA